MGRIFTLVLFFIGIYFSSFGQTHYTEYQDGLVIFQLKPTVQPIPSINKIVDLKSDTLFTRFLGSYSIIEVKQLHPEINDENLNRTYQIRLGNMVEVDQVIRDLNKLSIIEYAELKALHRLDFIPNDYFYSVQWALPKIKAEYAWDISFGSSSITVGVTDDAFRLNHPDLQGVFLTGHDEHDGDNNPSPCGTNMGDHGSHVSGIIGANLNNGTGVASIGGGVRILPVKIGDCSDQYLPYAYEGVVWAANNGADIINMSWGGGGYTNYGQTVMNNAWNNGVILVAAAGNDNVSSLHYPSCYNNVIAVASSDQSDMKSDFSNYGSWVDITAPGTAIASCGGLTADYMYMDGTSMATPMVSGLLGLMRSHSPSTSNTAIINCLLNTADPMPSEPRYNNDQMGSGRINAQKALLCLTAGLPNRDASIYIIEPKGSICTDKIEPKLELWNYGTTTLTSCTITYNWGGPPQTYNWTGSLSTGQMAIINLPSQTLPDGSYTFTATVSAPNGSSDQNPANNTKTTNFNIYSTGEVVTFFLQTDCWGGETTWEIIDNVTNNAVAWGGPYPTVVGGTSNTYSICLAVGCYTFKIYDDYGDGMSGAQYQGCSTNGYYRMEDAQGGLMFEMTAPNGNFGSSASHPFCITHVTQDDAGIEQIVSPTGIICSSTITPVVKLKNYGTTNLQSVDIFYQTSGAWQNYSWTGNLSPGQTQNVTLPSIAINDGTQTITAYTSNPNGVTDGNPSNDQAQISVIVQGTAASLPFVEDFEGSVSGWTVVNPDGSNTWSIYTTGGNTPGTNSAGMRLHGYNQTGQRDGLISPLIDLTDVMDAKMTFDHAYRRYNNQTRDSLIIYITTDCGDSWDRVFAIRENGTYNFATTTNSTTNFVPNATSSWCFTQVNGQNQGPGCFEVNLDAYVGHNIRVKFETYKNNNNGNNLYIDNINIIGTPIGDPPIPLFSTDKSVICEGETIQFTDLSTENPTSWNWTFPGGTPATSTNQNPSVTYASSGTYNVILEATNIYGTGTQTFYNEITVNAKPTVSISASATSICEGNNTVLTASGASFYSWDNSLGNGSNKTVSPSTTTTYTVTGTSQGCQNTSSITITVDEKSIVPTNITVDHDGDNCHGREIKLTEHGGVLAGSSEYVWGSSYGTNNISNGTTDIDITHVPNQTTTYYVGVSANGACPAQYNATGLTYTLPPKTGNLSTNEVATCYLNGTDPIHFYSPAGNYIGSINPNGMEARVSMESHITGNSINIMGACGDEYNPVYQTAFMERSFLIKELNSDNSALYNVYFPFWAYEYNELKAASSIYTTLNTLDDINTIGDLGVTKFNGPVENTNPFDNCGNGVGQYISQSDNNDNGSGNLIDLHLSPVISGNYLNINVPSFSEFYIHGGVGNTAPLPVELISFSVNCLNNQTQIQWVTASEQNSASFTVEFSRDGYNWTHVATVEGAGTSYNDISYLIIDQNNFNEGYYRLIQTDYNGEREIFGPISSECTGNTDKLLVYPNPSEGSFTVEIIASESLGKSTIQVHDVTGKKIVQKDRIINSGSNKLFFTESALAPGTYIISIEGVDKKKFVPIKLVINR